MSLMVKASKAEIVALVRASGIEDGTGTLYTVCEQAIDDGVGTRRSHVERAIVAAYQRVAK
jgi:hypothetical protein